MPVAQDWNNYWSLDQTQKFTKISWSKRRIIRILQPYMIIGNKSLDAGCGSGFFSKYFCDQGMDTTSLDYSDTALNIASNMTQGRTRIIREDLIKENLFQRINEKFDVIFSDGLLEHFTNEEQDKIVNNLLSVLSDNGVLITFVPNRWSPWELIRPIFMPGIDEDPFVLKGLVGVNQRNGLKVIAKGGINTIPFALSPDKLVGSIWGMLLFTISKKIV